MGGAWVGGGVVGAMVVGGGGVMVWLFLGKDIEDVCVCKSVLVDDWCEVGVGRGGGDEVGVPDASDTESVGDLVADVHSMMVKLEGVLPVLLLKHE